MAIFVHFYCVSFRELTNFKCISADRVHILEDRSLRLENIGLEDMGEYTCEADNAVGSIVSTGTLIVYGE